MSKKINKKLKKFKHSQGIKLIKSQPLVESSSIKKNMYHDYLHLFLTFGSQKAPCFHLSCNAIQKKWTPKKLHAFGRLQNESEMSLLWGHQHYLSLLPLITGYEEHLIYLWEKSGYLCSVHFSKFFRVSCVTPLQNNSIFFQEKCSPSPKTIQIK